MECQASNFSQMPDDVILNLQAKQSQEPAHGLTHPFASMHQQSVQLSAVSSGQGFLPSTLLVIFTTSC